jgi:RNA polymerase-binding protein DksA
MDDIRTRLDHNLTAALFRLGHLGGAVAVEELPGATRDNSRLADEIDEIQANENREISFATRERLVERANRLSAALERLNDGEYGICAECAERISPARLHAVPEVQNCVRCQDRIERFARRL